MREAKQKIEELREIAEQMGNIIPSPIGIQPKELLIKIADILDCLNVEKLEMDGGTTSKQMEILLRHGYGMGWLEKNKMFWAIKFDETDDRKYGWLKGEQWKLPSDVCASDSFSDAVSRTYKNVIERAGLG